MVSSIFTAARSSIFSGQNERRLTAGRFIATIPPNTIFKKKNHINPTQTSVNIPISVIFYYTAAQTECVRVNKRGSFVFSFAHVLSWEIRRHTAVILLLENNRIFDEGTMFHITGITRWGAKVKFLEHQHDLIFIQ